MIQQDTVKIIIICGIPIFVDPQIYISTKIGIHEFKWFGFVVLNATFNNIHLYHGCQAALYKPVLDYIQPMVIYIYVY